MRRQASIIREETRADEPVIHELITEAFRGRPRSDGEQPRIVRGLRDCGALAVSLVAEGVPNVDGTADHGAYGRQGGAPLDAVFASGFEPQPQ